MTNDQFDELLDTARINEADTLAEQGVTRNDIGNDAFDYRVLVGILANWDSYAEAAGWDYREARQRLADHWGYPSFEAMRAGVLD